MCKFYTYLMLIKTYKLKALIMHGQFKTFHFTVQLTCAGICYHLVLVTK